MPADQIESTRFTIADLRSLYGQMRLGLGPLGNPSTLEQQTFINHLVIAFRHGSIPLTWKYEPFEKISNFSQRFQITPLQGPTQNDNESPKMYQSKLGLAATGTQGHSNHWINWKMALTFFALLNSPFPTEGELAALRVKLTDAGTEQHVTKEQFIKVSYNIS